MSQMIDAAGLVTKLQDSDVNDAVVLGKIEKVIWSMAKEETPSRAQGQWKHSSPFTILLKNSTDSVRCPFCSAHINERIGEHWRFCPGCGAELAD